MNTAEQKLIVAMQRTAASHRKNGERRTAALLDTARAKIEQLLRRVTPAQPEETATGDYNAG